MQVYLDVTFTPWKWAVMAIFGILPLVLNTGLIATILGIVPAYRAAGLRYAPAWMAQHARSSSRRRDAAEGSPSGKRCVAERAPLPNRKRLEFQSGQQDARCAVRLVWLGGSVSGGNGWMWGALGYG